MGLDNGMDSLDDGLLGPLLNLFINIIGNW